MTRIDISAAVFDAVDRGEPIVILGRKYVPAPTEPAKTLRELIHESQQARQARTCGCGRFTWTNQFIHELTVDGMTHRRGQPCYDVSHP